MEKKILFAVDGSEKGFEAVATMGNILKNQPDLKLVLYHCVQQMARLLPGDLCLDVEEACRLPLVEQEKLGNTVLEASRKRLMDKGFPEDRIELRLKIESMDAAQDIISEAEKDQFQTIALGRRGRSGIENLLLGSISGKVAEYAQHRTVWIVDAPTQPSQKVLIAMEGVTDSKNLARYTADFLAPNPGFDFTFLHLMPPVPPTFWDDGHILGPTEQKDRQSRIEKWRSEWMHKVERFMGEARTMLLERGVKDEKIQTYILPTREGIARDLLNEIEAHKFQIVVMGKRSYHERKPFLMGSHAQKILQSVKRVILCLVDA